MILYQRKNYKSREIVLPVYGEVLISVTSLNEKLMLDSGNYASKEALDIDEKIYYFVTEDQIDLPVEELQALIISEVG